MFKNVNSQFLALISLVSYASVSFLRQYPDLRLIPITEINIFGVPLFPKGINEELTSRLTALNLTSSRLKRLNHRDALFLLKNAFFLPRLLYLLRTFPCHGNYILKDLNLCMKVYPQKITNCQYYLSIFREASLPV